jgi:AcrR family transcriptional regulator
MARPVRVSPDVILAAAALEFAARGFAGARVDRIARRAKVNKAMIYYHFKSKERLYRTLLRGIFTRAAERLQAIAGGPGAPADKIDLAIAAMAAFIEEHKFFPSIMLREVAEGGAHLDRETLKALAAVPRTVAAIVEEGVATGPLPPGRPDVCVLQHARADRVLPRGNADPEGALSSPRQHARAVARRFRRTGAGVGAPRAEA